MFRNAKDLNEFENLCKTLEEDVKDVEKVDGLSAEPSEGGADLDMPEFEPNGETEDFMTKFKGVMDRFKKVGEDIEDLVKDASTPAESKKSLVNFDKQLSKLYMHMFHFATKLKERSYTGIE